MSQRAILFDLDDTLIFAYAKPEPAWHAVVNEFAAHLGPYKPTIVANAIANVTAAFLSDDENRRQWRLQAAETRQNVVRNTLRAAGLNGLDEIAPSIADRYAAFREENMYLFPDAHRVIDHYRALGYKTGLVTNGATEVQRWKINKFDLAGRFDHIQIEEEAGYGKPDGRAYEVTLRALQVDPADAAMVGDDLGWDVAAPQRLGMTGIWYNPHHLPLPDPMPVEPKRTIHALSELL